MKNNEWINRLSKGLDALTPPDGFARIAQALPDIQAAPVRRPRAWKGWAVGVAAACVLALGLWGVYWYSTRYVVDTVVDIDVNPGIELRVNRSDRVLDVCAVNGDGQVVLDGLTLKQQPLQEVVSAILTAMVEKGYMAGDSNHILITIQNADNKRAEQILYLVNRHIGDTLAQREVKASIANQIVTDFDLAKEFAEKHGISTGKAAFILALVEQAPELDAGRLANYHFAALAVEAERHGVDLQTLVDYDAQGGIWGEIQFSLEQQVKEAEQKLGKTLLTLEEAKESALTGFDDTFRASVVFVKTELSWEGDTPVYLLEFISHQQAVYQYVINALDGSWLPTEAEKENATATQGETMYSTLPSGGTTVTSSRPMSTTTAWIDQVIGEEKAKAIALAERKKSDGIDPSKIQDVLVNRGELYEIPVYEVCFVVEDVWYAYRIHAVSGKILKLNKTPYTPPTTTKPTTPQSDGYINNNEAKTIVYKLLGITEAEVTFDSLARLPLNENSDQILFRFFHNDRLYVNYIHGATGEVLCRIDCPTDMQVEEYHIDEWEAQGVALTHAGVTEEECRERLILFRKTPTGTPCYFVSFWAKNRMYVYEISGVDGTILACENSEYYM